MVLKIQEERVMKKNNFGNTRIHKFQQARRTSGLFGTATAGPSFNGSPCGFREKLLLGGKNHPDKATHMTFEARKFKTIKLGVFHV